jgi:hypothetical protein
VCPGVNLLDGGLGLTMHARYGTSWVPPMKKPGSTSRFA